MPRRSPKKKASQILTLDGWADLMFAVVRETSQLSALFFFAVVLLGVFVLRQLFVAVLAHSVMGRSAGIVGVSGRRHQRQDESAASKAESSSFREVLTRVRRHDYIGHEYVAPWAA